MGWIETILSAFGIKKAALIAGIIGGWLSLRFFEGLTASGKWFTVAGGAAAANYLTQPLMAWFRLSPGDYEGGVGFAIGFFGMALAAAAITFIREDLVKIIRGRIGGGS